MKKFKELKLMTEEKKDKYDEGEYDQEGDMAKSDLRSIMANAKELHDMIDDADNLPEWCQNKITLAEDYISTVANYLTAEMSEEVKTVTVKHKTSGKELVVSPEKAKQLKPQGYHPVKEEIEQIGEEDAYSKDRYAVKNGKAVKDNPTHKGSSNYKDQPHHVYATSAEEALKKHMKKEEAEELDEASEQARDNKIKAKVYAAKLGSKFRRDNKIRKLGLGSNVDTAIGRKLMRGDPHDSVKAYASEEVEQINEKNVPTSPEKWAQAKAQAKAKFDVYPSAYANGWAAKKYKAMGGSWKSVSEATDPPFDKPYTTIKKVVTDKSGAKHSPMSRARDIARMAMKKQMEKMKPVKESLEESRKAEIVKEIMKKKKDKSEDAFQKDPELTTTLTKGI